MKLKTLLLTTALVTSSIAFANTPTPSSRKSKNQFEDYYAKIELGGTKANKVKGSATVSGTTQYYSEKSKIGFIGGLGGGYVFNEFFRTDLMLQYKKNKGKDEGKVDTYDAMLNGYLTAHNDTIFTPYLLAGVGVGHNTAKGKAMKVSIKTKQTNFIWNLGAGCAAKVADQASVDLTYRYVDLGKLGSKTVNIPTMGDTKVKIKNLSAHEIVAGLIYHF